ncbi:unnamed protein product [Cladocopium goreaui]|uniref:Uncharacterized protein n=1 Tax=Cladocopium goreaui TaxID=2562237 RepID=A0A9P1FUR1_9DINO|nr:unnamed protein product [Cladocopium goreaui]
MDLFKHEVPEFTHQPLVQTAMQQETLNAYQSPCWAKGFCSLESGCRNHERLHGMLLKEIRKQIDQKLPSSAAKRYVQSGDVAITVRYGQVGSASSSSAGAAPCPSEVKMDTSECKVFMLASLSLRPASAVLASMTIKPLKSFSIPSDAYEASFELVEGKPGKMHFNLQTSWEFVAYLLRQQKMKKSVVTVNVLEHRPTSINAIEFCMPKIDMANAVWPP